MISRAINLCSCILLFSNCCMSVRLKSLYFLATALCTGTFIPRKISPSAYSPLPVLKKRWRSAACFLSAKLSSSFFNSLRLILLLIRELLLIFIVIFIKHIFFHGNAAPVAKRLRHKAATLVFESSSLSRCLFIILGKNGAQDSYQKGEKGFC